VSRFICEAINRLELGSYRKKEAARLAGLVSRQVI